MLLRAVRVGGVGGWAAAPLEEEGGDGGVAVVGSVGQGGEAVGVAEGGVGVVGRGEEEGGLFGLVGWVGVWGFGGWCVCVEGSMMCVHPNSTQHPPIYKYHPLTISSAPRCAAMCRGVVPSSEASSTWGVPHRCGDLGLVLLLSCG